LISSGAIGRPLELLRLNTLQTKLMYMPRYPVLTAGETSIPDVNRDTWRTLAFLVLSMDRSYLSIQNPRQSGSVSIGSLSGVAGGKRLSEQHES